MICDMCGVTCEVSHHPPHYQLLFRQDEASKCIYLVDFGFAVASNSGLANRGVGMSKVVGFQGTPLYSAPETFESDPKVRFDACRVMRKCEA